MAPNPFQTKVHNAVTPLFAQQMYRNDFDQETLRNFVIPIFLGHEDETKLTPEGNLQEESSDPRNNIDFTADCSSESKSPDKKPSIENSTKIAPAKNSLSREEKRLDRASKYKFMSPLALNGIHINPQFTRSRCLNSNVPIKDEPPSCALAISSAGNDVNKPTSDRIFNTTLVKLINHIYQRTILLQLFFVLNQARFVRSSDQKTLSLTNPNSLSSSSGSENEQKTRRIPLSFQSYQTSKANNKQLLEDLKSPDYPSEEATGQSEGQFIKADEWDILYVWYNDPNRIPSSVEQLDDEDESSSQIIPPRGSELTLPEDFEDTDSDTDSIDSDLLSQISIDENRESVNSFNVSNISPPSSTFKTFSKIIQWGRHSYTLRDSLPDSTTEAQWNEIAKKYLAVLNDIPELAGVNHLTLSLDKKSETMKVIIPSENRTFDIQNEHVKELLNIYPFPLSTCLAQLSSSDGDDEIDLSKSSDTGSLKRYNSSPEIKPSAKADHQSESSLE
jgi:hypothetical protein